MYKFHPACKEKFDRFILLLKKYEDNIGVQHAHSDALMLNEKNKCGHCEKQLDRKSNLFRNKRAA